MSKPPKKSSKTNVIFFPTRQPHSEKHSGMNKCGKCKKEHEGKKSTCDECLIKLRHLRASKRDELLKNGVCLACENRSSFEASYYCETCWFKRISWNATGSIGNWRKLKTLWIEQNGLCALTNAKLIPGSSASIDHIIATSKGGSDEIHNLRWVHREVNQAKSNLSDREFYSMCKAVFLFNYHKMESNNKPKDQPNQ